MYIDSREQLKEHSINEHGGKKGVSIKSELTFSCETCNATFTSQEDLGNIASNNMKVYNSNCP